MIPIQPDQPMSETKTQFNYLAIQPPPLPGKADEMPELTIEASELKRLVLGAVTDLGRYGLEVTSESMAAVASLIVNSSKLGSRVDADDRERLLARIAGLAKENGTHGVTSRAIKGGARTARRVLRHVLSAPRC